jgi:hypothetical protein
MPHYITRKLTSIGSPGLGVVASRFLFYHARIARFTGAAYQLGQRRGWGWSSTALSRLDAKVLIDIGCVYCTHPVHAFGRAKIMINNPEPTEAEWTNPLAH